MTRATGAPRAENTGTGVPSRRVLAAWLLRHTRTLLPPLGLAIVFRIVGQTIGVALLVVAVGAVVRVAEGADGGSVLPPTLAWLVGLALVKAVLRYLEQYSGHYVAFAALASLRRLFFARLAPQAPAATDGASSGDLSARATRDIDRVEVFFAHTIPPAVAAVAVPAIALAWVAVVVDPLLAAVMVPVPLLVVAVVPFLSGRSTWRATGQRASANGRIAQYVSDSVGGVREIVGFDHGRERLGGLDERGDEAARAAERVGTIAGVRAALVQLVQFLGVVAVLLVGATLATDGSVGWAEVAVGIAVLVGIAGPSRSVDGFVADLDASFASAARLYEVLEREPVVTERPSAAVEAPRLAASASAPAVRVDGVSFGYPGRDEVLRDVSITVERGRHVAVVGVSGSGKSTLVSLLARSWDPTHGAVILDGTDVRDLPLDEVRRRVAIVAQRPFVFARSMRENLTLGAPDATDEELAAAVHVAALDDVLDSLPQGLDTPMRDRGARLSGGQLQRLAIARAIVTDPEVLVLDESTGALDAATEATVRSRLAAWAGGKRTIIEVTHRVDQVLSADHVIVLDRGRVVEEGSPLDLAASDGPFASLLARV